MYFTACLVRGGIRKFRCGFTGVQKSSSHGIRAALLAGLALLVPGLAHAQITTASALYSFPSSTPPASPTSVVADGNGRLYGTTLSGGVNGLGSVFAIAYDGALTTLHSFDGTDGAGPQAALLRASDGNFYGTTSGEATPSGPTGFGTVFRITPGGALRILYSFTGGSDGAFPQGGLVQGSDGNFYGTTAGSNAPKTQSVGFGTVFKLTPDGHLTTLYSFSGPDGAFPNSALVQGSDGNFYGTTEGGGNSMECTIGSPSVGFLNGCGTIFEITPAGALTSLYTFQPLPTSTDGAFPNTLMLGSDGNFYGTTQDGGQSPLSIGTVFEFTLPATLTTLHSFEGPDGQDPVGPLVEHGGVIYGVTQSGGSSSDGVAYQLFGQHYTLLYSFSGGADGDYPASLTLGRMGRVGTLSLYGVASAGGGTGDDGTVFKLTVEY